MPRERVNRTPEGNINNCALAVTGSEEGCQVCPTPCPDRVRLLGAAGRPAAGHKHALDVLVEVEDQPPPPGHPNGRARRLRVSWGDETIQPVQYNVFHTGTIEVEVELRPGEDLATVHAALYGELERLGTEQYRLKRDAFLARLADTAQVVRSRAAKPVGR